MRFIVFLGFPDALEPKPGRGKKTLPKSVVLGGALREKNCFLPGVSHNVCLCTGLRCSNLTQTTTLKKLPAVQLKRKPFKRPGWGSVFGWVSIKFF